MLSPSQNPLCDGVFFVKICKYLKKTGDFSPVPCYDIYKCLVRCSIMWLAF